IDQMALIAPHVKFAARPSALREVVPALEQAFHEAKKGVPGPVFVELAVDLLYPENVVRDQQKKVTEKSNKTLFEQALGVYIKGHLAYVYTELGRSEIHPPRPVETLLAEEKEIRSAVRMLESAERPLMVLGSQTMLHPSKTRELIEAIERLG